MIYQKTFFVVALLALAGLGTTASANTLVLDYGTNHSGIGGEFNVSSATLDPVALGYVAPAIVNAGHGLGFETFCLEYNEHFNPGGTYNYGISDAAFHGGEVTSDPLSIGTAWLYLNFAKGTLTGYNYSDSASAGDLQNTIWWLEGEISNPGAGNQFAALVLGQFGSAASAMMDNNGLYGVAVLNLTYLNGQLAQDQLILARVPDGGTTVGLLGLAMLGVLIANRKALRRQGAAIS